MLLTLTVPDIPVPVTTSPTLMSPALVSTTKAVVELMAPFTLAVDVPTLLLSNLIDPLSSTEPAAKMYNVLSPATKVCGELKSEKVPSVFSFCIFNADAFEVDNMNLV